MSEAITSQWMRKAPANQSGSSSVALSMDWTANATHMATNPTCAVGRQRNGPPQLRGRGWQTLNPDEDVPVATADLYGQSPLVGIKSSASAPVIAGKTGKTKDGANLERHGTDIHEGRPWMRSVPAGPDPNYDPEKAANNQYASLNNIFGEAGRRKPVAQGSSRDATDIHEGRKWRRAVPMAPDPNYGKNDPHPFPPHMRSTFDSVVYGRDMDFSELPEDAPPDKPGWSMHRRASDVRVADQKNPAGWKTLRDAQDQFHSKRIPSLVFGREGGHLGGGADPQYADPEAVARHMSDVMRETAAVDVAHDPSANYPGKPHDLSYPTSGYELGKSDVLSHEMNPFAASAVGGIKGRRNVEPGYYGLKHHQELFPAKITAEEAAVAVPRELPDESVRRAIVETDIQYYRNPDDLTIKRRRQYELEEAARYGQAPRDDPYDRSREFPMGTFNRNSGASDIHPGTWDKTYQDQLGRGNFGKVQQHFGKRKMGVLRPALR